MVHRIPNRARIAAWLVPTLLAISCAFAFLPIENRQVPEPRFEVCYTQIHVHRTSGHRVQPRVCDAGEKPGAVRLVYKSI